MLLSILQVIGLIIVVAVCLPLVVALLDLILIQMCRISWIRKKLLNLDAYLSNLPYRTPRSPPSCEEPRNEKEGKVQPPYYIKPCADYAVNSKYLVKRLCKRWIKLLCNFYSRCYGQGDGDTKIVVHHFIDNSLDNPAKGHKRIIERSKDDVNYNA